MPNKENVCIVTGDTKQGDNVEFTYIQKGAKVVKANLLYTLNGGKIYEEWFRKPAKLQPGLKATAQLPEGTTHYFINLIDENNFLRSYPEVELEKPNSKYSESALVF